MTARRAAFLLGSALAIAIAAGALFADVRIPPAPSRYFNDDASLVSTADADRLNAKLGDFDRQSSTQILVAIFPELPEPSLEDFTVRTAQAWRVGQKKLNNGAILFIFVKDHRSRIEVGYGLEGALPDATCKDILEDRLAPAFRQGQYAQGLESAIDSMIAATRGEYTAAPRRSAGPAPRSGGLPQGCVTMIVLFLVFGFPIFFRRRGWRTYGGSGWWTGGWGGGGWEGGGGGFSGGGGSFGGGGASGNW